MVWHLSYRPKPDSYPDADVIEGNSGNLELEDTTPDGGVALLGETGFSGRRAKPESVPKVIRWKSKRKLLDYETIFRKTVSERFRALIEDIEPGVHQFEPVRFVDKHGAELGTRWFWQICNRLDSVHREKTEYWLRGGLIWSPPRRSTSANPVGQIYDTAKIGSAKFWHDKHTVGGTFVADDAKERIDAAGITGVHFRHSKQY